MKPHIVYNIYKLLRYKRYLTSLLKTFLHNLLYLKVYQEKFFKRVKTLVKNLIP